MQEQATSSPPSSSERSSSSAVHQVKEGLESDEEVRRVPDFGGELQPGASISGRELSLAAATARRQVGSSEAGPLRKRGRDPADKEHKRLNELEAKVKELESRNSEVEERLSTLQNENQMLRHILKNTSAGRRGSASSANGEGSV